MILLLLACGAGTPAVSSQSAGVPEVVQGQDLDPTRLAPGEVTPILLSPPETQEASSVACAGSCTGPDPQDHDSLEAELIPYVFEEWNSQPVGEATLELETLLFYGADTEAFIQAQGTPGLDAEHAAFLEAELARDTVSLEMRLLDEAGQVVGRVPEQSFPLWDKQHITFQGTGSLGHLETGGKAKRVGLAHLWTRW